MNRLGPKSGFTFSPQSANTEILEKLKNKQVKWNLTSKGDKFSVKFEKSSAEFETLTEAINWLCDEALKQGVK